MIVANCQHVFSAQKITPPLETLLSQVPELSQEIKAGKQWDPKVGFRIPYGPYTGHYWLTCHATVRGLKVSSKFMPLGQSESTSTSFGGEAFY